MKKSFASYEKEISAPVIRTKHIIRILKGECVRDIEFTFNNINPEVCLTNFKDCGDFFELLFIEEQEAE